MRNPSYPLTALIMLFAAGCGIHYANRNNEKFQPTSDQIQKARVPNILDSLLFFPYTPRVLISSDNSLDTIVPQTPRDTLTFPLEEGTYEVSSRFGEPRPNGGPEGKHQGLDLFADIGAEVRAIMDGEVTYANRMGSYGRLVIIQHKKGESRYAHLSEMNVSKQDSVRAGQRIGKVGWSGHVNPKGPDGRHLHFEYRVKGRPKNPRILYPTKK